MPKNKNCAITDSPLCQWLDKDCERCYINSLKNDEAKQEALNSFEVMLSLLPDDFDELSGEKCQFCRKNPKKRAGYAVTDLGHAEPKTMKGMFFGIGKKVRRRIGSMVPLNISICKDCRRTFRLTEGIRWISIILLTAIAIVIVSLPSFSSRFDASASVVPYAVVAGGLLLGYIIGKLATAQYIKAKSRQTYLNIFEIPICAKMQEDGWFLVQDNPGVTRFIFSKKPVLHKIEGLKELKSSQKDDFEQTSFLEH